LPLGGAKFLHVYKYALLPFVQVPIVAIGSPFASSDLVFVMTRFDCHQLGLLFNL
jgi:hypothetical protein